MDKLEVLCVTMHQKDFSKIQEMNIQSDVVFANQADRYDYEELEFEGNLARMITTNQRGVGRNRNTALLYAKREICLLADDDIIYKEGYEKAIINAFKDIPKADIIIFNCYSNSEQKPRITNGISRVRYWNFMRHGTCRMAIRKASIVRKNIFFSLLFGGGAIYSSGEDSLFLKKALEQGLRVYTHPYFIGTINYETSTWFSGFNEKYFFDKGAWLQIAFPYFKFILACYFVLKLGKKSDLGSKKIFKLLVEGMKAYKKDMSYDRWLANKKLVIGGIK